MAAFKAAILNFTGIINKRCKYIKGKKKEYIFHFFKIYKKGDKLCFSYFLKNLLQSC